MCYYAVYIRNWFFMFAMGLFRFNCYFSTIEIIAHDKKIVNTTLLAKYVAQFWWFAILMWAATGAPISNLFARDSAENTVQYNNWQVSICSAMEYVFFRTLDTD